MPLRDTYIPALIAHLERQLSHLARHWHATANAGRAWDAATLVQRYHETTDLLRDLGWQGEHLAPESMLPNDLMPDWLRQTDETGQ